MVVSDCLVGVSRESCWGTGSCKLHSAAVSPDCPDWGQELAQGLTASYAGQSHLAEQNPLPQPLAVLVSMPSQAQRSH